MPPRVPTHTPPRPSSFKAVILSLVMPSASPYRATTPVRGSNLVTPPGELPVQMDPSCAVATLLTLFPFTPSRSVQERHCCLPSALICNRFIPKSLPPQRSPPLSRPIPQIVSLLKPSPADQLSHL